MDFSTTSHGNARPAIASFAIAAVLQIVVGSQLSLFGGSPNFMLALVAVLAVGGDPRSLVYIGFFAGLFFDLTSAVPIGLMSLLLTLVGFFAATASRGISGGLNMQSLVIASVSIAAVNVAYALALFFLGVESNLLVSLGVHALVSTVLTALVAAAMLALLPHAVPAQGHVGRMTVGATGFRAASRPRGTRFKTTRYKGLR